MRAFLTLQHGQRSLGTIYIDLFDDDVPKTVKNFVTLLQRPAGKGYKASSFHRIIRGFMAQGGDFTSGDGTGGHSIYGDMFPDENFRHTHGRAGVVAMANSGPHTNGSQFYITFQETPHLNSKHVVFGQVDMKQSADILKALERVPTNGKSNRPSQAVTISECGVVGEPSSPSKDLTADASKQLKTTGAVAMNHHASKDFVDVEVKDTHQEVAGGADDTGIADSENDTTPITKADAMKLRLRKLKQKMNQARQLNKQAVQEEGERIADPERERRRLAAATKKLSALEWEATHSKAVQMASDTGVDAKSLTEQGADSVRIARTKAEKQKQSRFHMNDYHNADSQHRNYERNLKSVASHSNATALDESLSSPSTLEYNPLDALSSSQAPHHGREGARRVATELHRRIEKRQERERKRKQKEIQMGTDDAASGINARNKRFNEKINRTYDKQTAEIRQNLERGTAL